MTRGWPPDGPLRKLFLGEERSSCSVQRTHSKRWRDRLRTNYRETVLAQQSCAYASCYNNSMDSVTLFCAMTVLMLRGAYEFIGLIWRRTCVTVHTRGSSGQAVSVHPAQRDLITSKTNTAPHNARTFPLIVCYSSSSSLFARCPSLFLASACLCLSLRLLCGLSHPCSIVYLLLCHGRKSNTHFVCFLFLQNRKKELFWKGRSCVASVFKVVSWNL